MDAAPQPATRRYQVVVGDGPVSVGQVLLSHPLLSQSGLTRSVIMLVKHNETTSFGLVVNRRMPFTMGDLIDSPDAESSRGMNGAVRESLSVFRENPIFRGGDVGSTFLSILHPHGHLQGAVKVCDGVYWQCDLAEAKELVLSGAASPLSFKLVLGYAGWAPRQLEGEVGMKTWLQVAGKGNAELAFSWGNEEDCVDDDDFDEASNTWTDEESWEMMADRKAGAVWSSVWHSLGGEYTEMASVPVRTDPHL